MNTYSYAYINPFYWVDPTGLFGAVAEVGIIGGGLGAIAYWYSIPFEKQKDIMDGLSSLIWPDDFKTIDPWTDTQTSTGVSTDILPPEIPDQCGKTYNDELKQCKSNCNNKVTQAACAAKAKAKYWLCKGAKKPKFGDDDFGGPSDPGVSGF